MGELPYSCPTNILKRELKTSIMDTDRFGQLCVIENLNLILLLLKAMCVLGGKWSKKNLLGNVESNK